jgi:hypothetical protein
MNIRKQIIKDAMTGKLTGKPFVPSKGYVEQEAARRANDAPNTELLEAPIHGNKVSDGSVLIEQLRIIQTGLQDLVTMSSDTEKSVANLKDHIFTEVRKIKRSASMVDDNITSVAGRSSLHKDWVPSVSEHFRTTENIDTARTTAFIDPQKHKSQLPIKTSRRITPPWAKSDKGSVIFPRGNPNSIKYTLSPGSSLANLIDDSQSVWELRLSFKERGAVDVHVNLDLRGSHVINYVELSMLSNTFMELYGRDSTSGEWRKLGKKELTDERVFWSFPPVSIDVLQLRFTARMKSAGIHHTTIDNLGIFLNEYGTAAAVISRSLSADSFLSRVSINVGESLPSDTSIDYFVGMDPLTSGVFINSQGQDTDVPSEGVLFDPSASGAILASVLRDWPEILGTEEYDGWEPQWRQIQPLNRGAIGTHPRYVSFESITEHLHPSGTPSHGMAVRAVTKEISPPNTPDPNTYSVPAVEYLSDNPGWWRPYVNWGEVVPAGSGATPDIKANNVDFYKIFYWPEDRIPVPGSITLEAGASVVLDTVGSGVLWSTANTSTPAMIDVTATNLTPSVSGVITILASGNIQFDAIRNLKLDGSYDEPFIRGDEYMVFGSGDILEIDVSTIEAQRSLFGATSRPYQITYTVERTKGATDEYTFITTVFASPDSDALIHIAGASLLNEVTLISVGNDDIIDSVDYIDASLESDIISRKLAPGYTRVILSSSEESYDLNEHITIETNAGTVRSVSVPMGMAEVSLQELLYGTPAHDHSKFATMPGTSGAQWLVVNDIGSERDLFYDANDLLVNADDANNADGNYLYHPSASGLPVFYNIRYDEALTEDKGIFFKAELKSNNPYVSPSLDYYKIDVGPKIRKISHESLANVGVER